MTSFAGVHPVLQTPFDDSPGQRILLDRLAALVDVLVEQGADGVVGLGLASEAGTLTEEERDGFCQTVSERLAGRLPFTVGIDGPTNVAAERTRRAVGLGATAVMVIPPAAARTPDQLVEHFRRVADAGGVPVLVQDAPQVTGVQLPAETLHRMSAHPLIGAVKVEGLDAGPKTSHLVASSLRVMAGWGGLHYPESFGRGAVGCMPGSDLGAALSELHGLLEQERHEDADRLYRAILPLLAYQTQSLAMLVLGAKRAHVRAGLFPNAAMRAPASQLDARQKGAFDALFDRLESDDVPGPWAGRRASSV